MSLDLAPPSKKEGKIGQQKFPRKSWKKKVIILYLRYNSYNARAIVSMYCFLTGPSQSNQISIYYKNISTRVFKTVLPRHSKHIWVHEN